MIGTQIKEFRTSTKDETGKNTRTLTGAGKKTYQDATGASKLESGQSKKLIFSFKKESKDCK